MRKLGLVAVMAGLAVGAAGCASEGLTVDLRSASRHTGDSLVGQRQAEGWRGEPSRPWNTDSLSGYSVRSGR